MCRSGGRGGRACTEISLPFAACVALSLILSFYKMMASEGTGPSSLTNTCCVVRIHNVWAVVSLLGGGADGIISAEDSGEIDSKNQLCTGYILRSLIF